MRAPLPTTDALFAQEVEQKMSNLLAGFGAVQSFLDRTKHRTATQLAAAETSPGTSKFESDLPGWEDSNFDVTQADRLGRGSQCGRDGDCGQETVQPNREDHSPLGPQAASRCDVWFDPGMIARRQNQPEDCSFSARLPAQTERQWWATEPSCRGRSGCTPLPRQRHTASAGVRWGRRNGAPRPREEPRHGQA